MRFPPQKKKENRKKKEKSDKVTPCARRRWWLASGTSQRKSRLDCHQVFGWAVSPEGRSRLLRSGAGWRWWGSGERWMCWTLRLRWMSGRSLVRCGRCQGTGRRLRVLRLSTIRKRKFFFVILEYVQIYHMFCFHFFLIFYSIILRACWGVPLNILVINSMPCWNVAFGWLISKAYLILYTYMMLRN